jgi:hypothetical protein
MLSAAATAHPAEDMAFIRTAMTWMCRSQPLEGIAGTHFPRNLRGALGQSQGGVRVESGPLPDVRPVVVVESWAAVRRSVFVVPRSVKSHSQSRIGE